MKIKEVAEINRVFAAAEVLVLLLYVRHEIKKGIVAAKSTTRPGTREALEKARSHLSVEFNALAKQRIATPGRR
jgi:hypothetical protein